MANGWIIENKAEKATRVRRPRPVITNTQAEAAAVFNTLRFVLGYEKEEDE